MDTACGALEMGEGDHPSYVVTTLLYAATCATHWHAALAKVVVAALLTNIQSACS